MFNSQGYIFETETQIAIIGASMLSPRLSNLDRERQLSMADEGGFSAAVWEGENNGLPLHSPPSSNSWKDWLSDSKVITSTILAVGLGYMILKQKKATVPANQK
jgi:hypothetical protein